MLCRALAMWLGKEFIFLTSALFAEPSFYCLVKWLCTVQIRQDYFADKVTAGPQSRILEGINWEEAQSLKVSLQPITFWRRELAIAYTSFLVNNRAADRLKILIAINRPIKKCNRD